MTHWYDRIGNGRKGRTQMVARRKSKGNTDRFVMQPGDVTITRDGKKLPTGTTTGQKVMNTLKRLGKLN